MKKISIFVLLLMSISACQESLEEMAIREAKTYTKKNCPQIMNQTQRMDSLTFNPISHTFGYHYLISGTMDTTAAFHEEYSRKLLIENVKNATALKSYKDAGYNFEYVYHSQKQPGVILFSTVIRQDDYR
jgi:hypothetical protein